MNYVSKHISLFKSDIKILKPIDKTRERKKMENLN